MAKIFNDFHFQIFVQMFVFNSWPKKQHSLYKKNRRENCHDAKKCWGWDLFHLTRPLVAVYSYKYVVGKVSRLSWELFFLLRLMHQWSMSCERDFFTLKLRVNSLPLATIYEVKIPLRKWKKSLLQRNPAQMTWANVS
jgi:hypothetical protein